MVIRFYIDPATGEPHIYNHNVDEEEVEDILKKPVVRDRGRDDTLIAVGQTQAGRPLRVIYKEDLEQGGESGRSDVDRNVYPPGWDHKRVQELIAYYDQQTEDEIAADLEAALDAQEADEQASAAAYRDAINDGLRDLPAGILAEIADFVYFVRKRSLGLKD